MLLPLNVQLCVKYDGANLFECIKTLKHLNKQIYSRKLRPVWSLQVNFLNDLLLPRKIPLPAKTIVSLASTREKCIAWECAMWNKYLDSLRSTFQISKSLTFDVYSAAAGNIILTRLSGIRMVNDLVIVFH